MCSPTHAGPFEIKGSAYGKGTPVWDSHHGPAMNGTSQVGGSLTRGSQYGPQGLRAVNAGRQQVRSLVRQLMAGASGGCLIWPHLTAFESMQQHCPLPFRCSHVSSALPGFQHTGKCVPCQYRTADVFEGLPGQ